MTNKPTIYVASAGTGKTTALMDELNEALKETTPDTVVFTTFTNAGAAEAATRAREKFPTYNDHQFRYFRTLHSLSYRNIPQRKMISFSDFLVLNKELGLNINPARAVSQGYITMAPNKGDKLLQIDNLRRSRMWTYDEAFKNQESSDFAACEIQDFSEAYTTWKKNNRVYDFTDQLEVFLSVIDDWDPKITHLFVDECQDLSTLQWAIVNKIQAKATYTIIAGDDKQSIYKFSGGDPDALINLVGDRKILTKSYRLPETLLAYAENIADRITNKQEYTVTPNNTGGEIEYVGEITEIEEQLKKGTWFLLARNRKYLAYYEHQLNRLGIVYESDTGNGAFSPELAECVIGWADMLDGFDISVKLVKRVYSKYLKGPSVAYGFKKVVARLDDQEYVDKATLTGEYGLQNLKPWHESFSLPESLIEPLKHMEATGELKHRPRIRIATIHSVKGKEADNVLLLPDMTSLTHNSYNKDADSEHRVFYVGATRARKHLYLHKPLTDMFYPL